MRKKALLDAIAAHPGLAVLAAWVFRVAFALARANPVGLIPDASANVAAARLTLQTGRLALDRQPVYAAFLTLAYVWPGDTARLALLLQATIGAVAAGLSYRFARTAVSPPAAALAAWWVAVDPFLIYFSSLFLSETLFTTLLLGGFWLAAEALDGQRAGMKALIAGATWALAALCRNIFIPFLPLLALATLAGIRWRRASWAPLIALLAGMGLVLGSWMLCVHRWTGFWRIAAPQRGWTMYEGLNPHFESARDIERWMDGMNAESAAHGLVEPADKELYFWKKSVAWIHEHPLDYARLMARKFAKFWSVVPMGEYYSGAQRAVSALYFGPLLLFACLGLLLQAQKARSLGWSMTVLILFVVAYSLFNTIAWTQIRYRLPIHPLLAILAGDALARMLGGDREDHA